MTAVAQAVRPEPTFGLVRHYAKVSTICVWCERPIQVHIRRDSDGYRWATFEDCVNPVPEDTN